MLRRIFASDVGSIALVLMVIAGSLIAQVGTAPAP
jgi:hypothetical protein